ncbi:MAG: hypothetical protein ACK4KV_18370 [Rhodocyclaceae bacterium]
MKIYTEEERDQFERESALMLEQEHRQMNGNPSFEQLFMWGMNIFRNKGDPRYSDPKPHFMRLAKKYFDQIPMSHFSKKQARELSIFNHRYEQIVRTPDGRG